jgi:G:T-mismatch repair DNA endonuclease (very short patch repair protein)
MINEGRHHKTKIICSVHGMFEQEVKSHSKGHGCMRCAISNNCSKDQIEWLDLLSKSIGSNIQHALNLGELLIEDSRYRADGFLEINDKKIVFEFHGCYWHGCAKCYPNREATNEVAEETFDVLHKRTCERRQFIISKGYKYIEIYECEFKTLKSDEEKMKTHILCVSRELSDLQKQPIDLRDSSSNTIAIHAVPVDMDMPIIETPIVHAVSVIETDDILEEEELVE